VALLLVLFSALHCGLTTSIVVSAVPIAVALTYVLDSGREPPDTTQICSIPA